MKILLGKIFFILVALCVLLFAFSNTDLVGLRLWPLMGILHAPLFLVVLIVFVLAFFLGVFYGGVAKNKDSP